MTEQMIQLNKGAIKHELKEPMRGAAWETPNKLLRREAPELPKTGRRGRTAARAGKGGHSGKKTPERRLRGVI